MHAKLITFREKGNAGMSVKHMLVAATCGVLGLSGAVALAQQAAAPAGAPPARVGAPGRAAPTPPQTDAQKAAVPTNENEMRRPNNISELPAFPGQTRAPVDKKGVQFNQTVWATGLLHPWALQFLPDGRGLVTERAGTLRYIAVDGKLSGPIIGMPTVSVVPAGQSGLFDVALDPKFKSNSRIYFSYMAAVDGGMTLTVMRAELKGVALVNQKVIFQAMPVVPASNNMGGRLLFDKTGAMFVTVGDRFSSPTDEPGRQEPGFTQQYKTNQAQMLNSDLGKIVRIDTDGKPAKGNPFLNNKDARGEIYSIGERSEEAIAINPKSGDLWSVEFGPRGGDEVNIIKPGKNYGWPVITYGTDYTGGKILGDITQQAGMEQPIYYWDPSFSPSGLMFYTGDKFPAWKGSLFVGGLSAIALGRLTLNGDKVVGEERLLTELRKRIRDVRQGPDGNIYVVTDTNSPDAQVIRLTPKK
jgi:glucose/arabinose dehydrogenase